MTKFATRAAAVAAAALLAATLAGCSSSAASLAVGECIAEPTTSDVASVERLDCTAAHDLEVYAVGNVEAANFVELDKNAQTFCLEAFQPYVGKAYEESELGIQYFTPDAVGFGKGDRNVQCLAAGPSGEQLTASVKGSNR